MPIRFIKLLTLASLTLSLFATKAQASCSMSTKTIGICKSDKGDTFELTNRSDCYYDTYIKAGSTKKLSVRRTYTNSEKTAYHLEQGIRVIVPNSVLDMLDKIQSLKDTLDINVPVLGSDGTRGASYDSVIKTLVEYSIPGVQVFENQKLIGNLGCRISQD